MLGKIILALSLVNHQKQRQNNFSSGLTLIKIIRNTFLFVYSLGKISWPYPSSCSVGLQEVCPFLTVLGEFKYFFCVAFQPRGCQDFSCWRKSHFVMNSVELVICVKVYISCYILGLEHKKIWVLILVFHCGPEKVSVHLPQFFHASGDNYNDIDTVGKSVLDIIVFFI